MKFAKLNLTINYLFSNTFAWSLHHVTHTLMSFSNKSLNSCDFSNWDTINEKKGLKAAPPVWKMCRFASAASQFDSCFSGTSAKVLPSLLWSWELWPEQQRLGGGLTSPDSRHPIIVPSKLVAFRLAVAQRKPLDTKNNPSLIPLKLLPLCITAMRSHIIDSPQVYALRTRVLQSSSLTLTRPSHTVIVWLQRRDWISLCLRNEKCVCNVYVHTLIKGLPGWWNVAPHAAVRSRSAWAKTHKHTAVQG